MRVRVGRQSTTLSGSPLEEAVYGGRKCVTVSSSLDAGSPGGIFVSSNATTRTHIAAGQDMGGVVYGDGQFVAVGSSFQTVGTLSVYASTNGTDFETVDLAETANQRRSSRNQVGSPRWLGDREMHRVLGHCN